MNYSLFIHIMFLLYVVKSPLTYSDSRRCSRYARGSTSGLSSWLDEDLNPGLLALLPPHQLSQLTIYNVQ